MCEWARGDGYQVVPEGFVLYSCLFQELCHCHEGFWPKYCHIYLIIHERKMMYSQMKKNCLL